MCTYRCDELHRQHPLRPFLAEEERRHVVERLQVAAFSQTELADQVAGILGAAAEPGLVARLHARTEGNAFFAEELLAASDAASGPLPSNLRDVLNLRLEALPDDARGVLRVAAAAGRRSGHRLLAAVVGLPEPALVEGLREAVAQHVLVQDADGYAFRHALLQEAAYADLLPGERTALHLALAEALRDDPSLAAGTAAAELALHWRAAHRMPEALAAYVRAGLEAEQVFAFVEAAQHFERALEIWDLVPDAEARSELSLLRVVSHAAHNMDIAGEHHRAVTLGRMAREQADQAGDVVASALARESLGRSLWLAGDSDGALAAYRDAVRVLPPEPPTAELARVLAAEAQILMLRAPGDVPRAACEHAIEVARAVGAKATEGHATNSLGVIKMGTGDFEGAERALREAMRIAEEVTDLDGIGAPTRTSASASTSRAAWTRPRRSRSRAPTRPTASGCAPTRSSCRARRAGASRASAASTRRARDGRARAGQGPKGVAAVVLHDNAAASRDAPRPTRRGGRSSSSRRSGCSGATSDSMWIGARPLVRAETCVVGGRARGTRGSSPPASLEFALSRTSTPQLHDCACTRPRSRAAADRAQRALARGDHDEGGGGTGRRPLNLRRACAPCWPPSAGRAAPRARSRPRSTRSAPRSSHAPTASLTPRRGTRRLERFGGA